MRFLTKKSNEQFPVKSMFEDFIDRFYEPDVPAESNMQVDLIERDKEFEIKANLPGIDKKNVSITTRNNHLVIEAKQEKKKEEKEKGKVVYSEIYSGNYQRVIGLPEGIDKDNIKAKMKDGILKVNIPKSKEKLKKEISVE